MISEIDILAIRSGQTLYYYYDTIIEAQAVRDKVKYLNDCGYRSGKTIKYRCYTSPKKKLIKIKSITLTNDKKYKIANRRKYQPVFTYLAKDVATGYIKIGRSKVPEKRIRSLSYSFPQIQLLYINERDIEGFLHKMYKEYKVFGEWYNLNDTTLIEIIKRYRFGNYDEQNHFITPFRGENDKYINELTRKDLENIKVGKTTPFPLENESCLEDCINTIKMANDNWLPDNVGKFIYEFHKRSCVLSITAVKKEA